MKRRKGILHYVEIALLAVLCIPLGAVITILVSFCFNIPTPGLYAMRIISDPEGGGFGSASFDPLIPRLLVAGFVNAICCYLPIRGLAVAMSSFKKQKRSATP